MEIWKDIPGYEGRYQVSDQGRVKALSRRLRFVSKQGNEAWRVTAERICAQNITREGYALVHFQVDYERAVKTVHELVAVAFIGPRPPGLEVNHKDGDKLNNVPGNLEYATSAENKLHAVRTGLLPFAKRVVRGDGVVFGSINDAARSVGVACGSITYAIRKGTQCRGFRWVLA